MAKPGSSLPARIVVSLVLIVACVAGGALGFRVLAGMRKPPQKGESILPPVPVRVEVVQRRDFRQELVGYGRARALRVSDLSAEVAAVVLWISPTLEAGAAVEAGAELVRLDARDFEIELEARRAELAQAQAQQGKIGVDTRTFTEQIAIARGDLESALNEVRRVKELQENGGATKSELDREKILASFSRKQVVELQGRIDSLAPEQKRVDAQVRSSQAAVARAERDLARAVIRAPYSGRVQQRSVQVGVRVAIGTPLCRIVDLSRVEIPVALPASRMGDVSAGASATVRLSRAGDPIWTGTVARVAPGVNTNDRTFFVYLEVSGEGEGAIAPGTFVVANISGSLFKNVIPITRMAFLDDSVFVVDGGSPARARKRDVEIFVRLPHIALVRNGLEPGDKLIVTNLEQIADGTEVVIAERSGSSSESSSNEALAGTGE
ncbi:MAG: efflux RND transporter periplasmic adaptor subunit [Planctomycetota bacterium]